MSYIEASFLKQLRLFANVGIEAQGAVTGATVTAALQRQADGFYLDFGTSPREFAASPGTRTVTLSAEGTEDGLYEAFEDPWTWATTGTPQHRPTERTQYQAIVEVTAPVGNIAKGIDSVVISPWLAGEPLRIYIDPDGNDSNGWQEVHENLHSGGNREVARFNLFDQNGARIAPATPQDFVREGNIVFDRVPI